MQVHEFMSMCKFPLDLVFFPPLPEEMVT